MSTRLMPFSANFQCAWVTRGISSIYQILLLNISTKQEAGLLGYQSTIKKKILHQNKRSQCKYINDLGTIEESIRKMQGLDALCPILDPAH